MELRVLNYFLVVAEEENITKAAKLLSVTQPTLSRQLMDLEEELGVKLLNRNKFGVSLTDDGRFLKRRAEQILALSEKTKKELSQMDDLLAGEIAIGCAESRSMAFISEKMASFRQKYPLVQFNIYTAIADDVKDRLESGLLDLGLLVEPVNIDRYEFVRLPARENWCILVREDSPLAKKEYVKPEDLKNVPLIMAKRNLVRHELSSWFGEYYENLNIAAYYDFVMNASYMVQQGLGVAICFDFGAFFENLCTIPFYPNLQTSSVLVWNKSQTMSEVGNLFIEYVRNSF